MYKRKNCISYLPAALTVSGAIGLALGLPQIAQATVVYTGVAAGDATSDSAIVWTRTTDSANGQGIATNLKVQVSPEPNFRSRTVFFTGATDPNRDYTLKLPVGGLKSGTRYYYRFQAIDGSLSPVGTFKTAPNPRERAAVRFGFSGDADGQWRPYASTQNFNQQNLDYFIFLGDTIYETKTALSAATADPLANPTQALADYHRKYREQFFPVTSGGFPGLRTLFAAQGNYTLLDNHELWNKQFINGGAPAGTPMGAGVDATNTLFDANTTGTFINQTPGFKTLLQAYSDYQPLRERTISAPEDPRTNGTQKLYFARIWGANSVFINLDDRSYRDIRLKTAAGADDTGSRADNPNRTMLGKTQLAWFKKVLLDAQARDITWKIVALSSPIDQVGGDGGKSWIGGYRVERREILKFITDNQIQNVVFLSTDDHQNRVNELTYLENPSDPTSLKVVPHTFTIVAGPLGAGGPDAITDHSFPNLKKLADTLVADEVAKGINPIGLDPQYPGLINVVREGDPNANSRREAIDFYSPDTFNYATLDISQDGKVLSVKVYGINSYGANTFPEPSQTGPVREILGFQVKATPQRPVQGRGREEWESH